MPAPASASAAPIARLTSYDVLLRATPFDAAVLPTEVPNLDIVPATVDLSAAEIELVAGRAPALPAARRVRRRSPGPTTTS